MNYHPHDAKWIKEMVGPLSETTTKIVLDKYKSCYRGLMEKAGDDPIAKQAARTESNTRLRRYIEANHSSTA